MGSPQGGPWKERLPVSTIFHGRTMKIDIAICTWNRSSLLAQTLLRLMELSIPPEVEWQLLVINNNSTDDTADVLTSFESRLPLSPVFEPQPGQAQARNRALSETRADYVIWTDDDVLVDPGWLAAYARAFQRWPDAAFFGGPVEPWFEGTPPRWLADHWQQVANVFAVRALGDEVLAFDANRVPYGANFAVKIAIHREYAYDPTLGLRPGSEVRGEETQILRRMLADGHTGWWVPDAKVRHFVPRARQSLSYLRRFLIGQGELQGRELSYGPASQLFGRPRWLVRRALAAEARYQWSRLTAPPEVWLARLVDAATMWGQLKAMTPREAAPGSSFERR
jgi:glycosyltransferase involved in cell wall biosynthesis